MRVGRRRLRVLALQRDQEAALPVDDSAGALGAFFTQLVNACSAYQVVIVPGRHRTGEWRRRAQARMRQAFAGDVPAGTRAAALLLQWELLGPVPEGSAWVPATAYIAWPAPGWLEGFRGRQTDAGLVGVLLFLAGKSNFKVVGTCGFEIGGVPQLGWPVPVPPLVKVLEVPSVPTDEEGFIGDIVAGAVVSLVNDGGLRAWVGVTQARAAALGEMTAYLQNEGVYPFGFHPMRSRKSRFFQPDLKPAKPQGFLPPELPEPIRAAFCRMDFPSLGWGPAAVPLGKRKSSAINLAIDPTLGNSLILGAGNRALGLLQRVACGTYAVSGGQVTVVYISPYTRQPPAWLAPLSACCGDVAAVDLTRVEPGGIALEEATFRFFRFGHGVRNPLPTVAEVVERLFAAAKVRPAGAPPVIFFFEDFVTKDDDEGGFRRDQKWDLYRLISEIATQGPTWDITVGLQIRPTVLRERYNPLQNAQTVWAEQVVLPGQGLFVRELVRSGDILQEQADWYDKREKGGAGASRILWLSSRFGVSRVDMRVLDSPIFNPQFLASWEVPGWEVRSGAVQMVRRGVGPTVVPQRFQAQTPQSPGQVPAKQAAPAVSTLQPSSAQAQPTTSPVLDADASDEELAEWAQAHFSGRIPRVDELVKAMVPADRAQAVLDLLLSPSKEIQPEPPTVKVEELEELKEQAEKQAPLEPEEAEPDHEAWRGVTSTQRRELREAGVADLVSDIADQVMADEEVATWLRKEDRRSGDAADGWPVFGKILVELVRLINRGKEDPQVMFEQLAEGELPFRELIDDLQK